MGGPTQVGLESTMSPSTLARERYNPTPAVSISLVRLPRRKYSRVAVCVASSASSVFSSAVLRPGLVHANGMPTLLVASQVSMTRLAGAGGAAGGPAGVVGVGPPPPPAGGAPAAG